MTQIVNIYCDESCHLENDCQKAMVIGAVFCPEDKKREISLRIKEIKEKHGVNRLSSNFEVKWTKVSKGKILFYMDLVDFFFDCDHLNFRAVVITDKGKLNHQLFSQTHDDWYYKMYFEMLKVILKPSNTYNIFLDIKDTKSKQKVEKLRECLCNSMYDFDKRIIGKIQQARSNELDIMQLCDLFIGALSYVHRNLDTNDAKNKLIGRIKKRSGKQLTKTTLYQDFKFNILVWRAMEC